MSEIVRCGWVGVDPLMQEYHDREWGVPEHDGRRLWGKLALDGFQAGLSWAIVLRKREALRRAFEGFDPERVARYREKEIRRLLIDASIIRSRAKIESAIAGARAYLAMEAGGESFSELVWGLAGGRPIQGQPPMPAETALSAEISMELKRRGFRFVGPTIVYAWMQAVGIVNDHAAGCFRRAPLQRLALPPRPRAVRTRERPAG